MRSTSNRRPSILLLRDREKKCVFWCLKSFTSSSFHRFKIGAVSKLGLRGRRLDGLTACSPYSIRRGLRGAFVYSALAPGPLSTILKLVPMERGLPPPWNIAHPSLTGTNYLLSGSDI